MPAYIWSCLSCGTENAPGAAPCVACACPAAASFSQIAASRQAYLAGGGTVLAGAGKLPEEGDNDVPKAVLHVLGRLMALVFAGSLSQ